MNAHMRSKQIYQAEKAVRVLCYEKGTLRNRRISVSVPWNGW